MREQRDGIASQPEKWAEAGRLLDEAEKRYLEAVEAATEARASMKEDALNSNVRTKLFGGSLNVIGDYHEYWNDALVPVQLRRRNQPSDTNHC